VSNTAREVRAGIAANGGEAASLVESAMLLRWRAPELALLLADRAVSAAQDDKIAVLRADYLAVFTLNRLGRHAEAAHRLFPAIHHADTPQGLRHELHVELAHCAAALGEPATALWAVHPVLAAGDDVAPALRGGALMAVAEASATLGCDDLVTSALQEADELYREDPSLDHDTTLLLRAAARATDAVRHRARGAADKAEAKAREGRELLAGLADPDHDSGEVSARLMLELSFVLLDRGAGQAVMHEVRPVLRRPVRAAAAAAAGRLRLVIATRVHLADGRHEPALTLLADAVEGAQRYGMDAVLAECLEGLSYVHEARDEFADALHCMRAARAAEGRHLREVAAARSTLLEHCGSARREEARVVDQVTKLLSNAREIIAEPSVDRGIQVDTPEDLLVEVLAPAAQIADPGLTEADEAEPVEIARPEVAVADVPKVDVPAVDGETDFAAADVATDLTVVAESESTRPIDAVVAPVAVNASEAESSSELKSWQSRARHRRGELGTVVSVSDLLPASALSAGPSGRRRAEDSAVDRMDETSAAEIRYGDDGRAGEGGASQQHMADNLDTPAVSALVDPEEVRPVPVAGPPPAPTPRALEWESTDDDSAEEGESHQMGLGDLLAEALAAYQESRDVHPDARFTRAPHTGGSPAPDANTGAPDANTGHDLPRDRGLGARWTSGLALAPNPHDSASRDPSASDVGQGEFSEATTSPLLRLPELTAEPQWAPPQAGRRPAVGG
jgi:hypothetical protein